MAIHSESPVNDHNIPDGEEMIVMTQPFEHTKTEFYLTPPGPCPYLPNREERKTFSFLSGQAAPIMNTELSKKGFRRSQNIIYIPSCDHCSACVPVRINTTTFKARKSHRRIVNRNRDIRRQLKRSKATSEQFSVLRSYLDARHIESGMSDMTALDYTSMVEHTAVDTLIVEYASSYPPLGRKFLVGCSLTDRLSDGLSMVYSFFDPDEAARSLGTFMILDHIALAQELSLPYVYLGYWIKGSAKMDYKKQFHGAEYMIDGTWQPADQ